MLYANLCNYSNVGFVGVFFHPDFSLKLVVDCLLKLSLFNRLELASK